MSFAERNKRWLLPVLGVAAAGIVWSHLPARPGAEVEQELPEPAAPGQEPQAEALSFQPPPAPGTGAELLRLREPPASANDTAQLLLAGRQAVAGEPGPAALHPDQWTGLYRPASPEAAQPPRSPAPAPGPPPVLDFIIDTGSRREAWIKGRGFRPGAVLEGGYVLKRITADGVILAGPGGEVNVDLKPAQRRGGRP